MTTISVFQTIQTKYISPTNFKGTRIKASTSSGISIMRSYDYALNIGENHAKVARELQEKMKWHTDYYGDLVGGQNANGSYTWIMVGNTQASTASDAS
jgi:hypothetical protein